MKSKIISLVIAGLYIGTSLIYNDLNTSPPQDCISTIYYYLCSNKEYLSYLILYLFFSLALIWFGDDIGRYIDTNPLTLSSHTIYNEVPGIFIKIMGWFFLLLPIILLPIIFFVEAK